MPIIHKSWDLLKRKLAEIDGLSVDKRVGEDNTLVFCIAEHEYNPSIPILDEDELERWMVTKLDKPISPTHQPIKKQPKLIFLEPKPATRPVSSIIDLDEQPPPPSPPPPKQAHKHSEPVAPPPVTKSRKQIIKTRPKKDKKSKSKSSDKPEKKSAKPPTPEKPKPFKPPLPEKKSTNETYTLTQGIGFDSAGPNLSEDEASSASNATEDSVRTTNAVFVSSIDALILNEDFEDEYAIYADDEVEEETALSKNMKKIRTAPVAPTIPTVTSRPRPPSPRLSPPSSQDSAQSPLSPLSPHSRPSSPPLASSPPPPPRPVTPPKPDWPETAKQLEQNNFINAFKDFNFFQDQLKTDTTARKLLQDAVIKCLREDETTVLIDLLQLVYENNYENETDWWSELILRFKRKLFDQAQVRIYKSKTDPEWIHENYKRAMASIATYVKSANLKLTLTFDALQFIIDHLKPESPKKVQPEPPEESTSNDVVKSDPIEETKPVVTNIIQPDLNIVKVEKQENIDPSIERKVTCIKNDQGKTLFRIVRPKSIKKPLFSYRL